MKQRIALALLFCLLMAGTTLAGTGRYLALGSDPFFVRDGAEAGLWYTRLLDHADRIELELGDVREGPSATRADLGAIHHGGRVQHGLGRDGHFGKALFTFEDQRRDGDGDGALGVVWSKDLGRLRVALAGHFTTYGLSRNGSANGDMSYTRYLHRFGAGVGGRLGENGFWEVAGEILDSSVSRSEALYNFPGMENGGSYGLRARAFLPLEEGVALIPVLDYTREDRADLDEGDGLPVQLDDDILRAGLGLNLRPAEDQLFIVGFRYDNVRENRDWTLVDSEVFLWDGGSRDAYLLTLKAAAEYQLGSLLTLAGGIRYERLHEERTLFAEGDLLTSGDKAELVQVPVSLGLILTHQSFRAELGYNDRPPFTRGPLGTDPITPSGKGYTALTLTYLFP